MASVGTEQSPSPSPSTNYYSTFRRPSTLEGPKYDNTDTPRRLVMKMRGVGLPITRPVRDFAHTMTKELQEEEKRSRDATDAFTNISKRLSALENQVGEIPLLRQQVEVIPSLRQQVKVIPGLLKQVEEIPSLRQQVKVIPGLLKQVEEIPSLRQQVEEIPSLRQQVEEIPSLRQQVEEIPGLLKQVEEIPSIQRRIQELEDESEKTRGVTTKGQCAAFRELIQWGMKQDTVVAKTVRAYNQKNAASGGRRVRAGNVKREASIIIPFLHMELHVSDMLDWQAALARIPDNLAANYPLGMCLAETSFEEVFGFHPTESGSGILQNEECGKSNYNLASSLILY
jgi:hypothetical protein